MSLHSLGIKFYIASVEISWANHASSKLMVQDMLLQNEIKDNFLVFNTILYITLLVIELYSIFPIEQSILEVRAKRVKRKWNRLFQILLKILILPQV